MAPAKVPTLHAMGVRTSHIAGRVWERVEKRGLRVLWISLLSKRGSGTDAKNAGARRIGGGRRQPQKKFSARPM